MSLRLVQFLFISLLTGLVCLPVTYFFIFYDSPFKPFGSPWLIALAASFFMMLLALRKNINLDRRFSYLLILSLAPIFYKFIQIFLIPTVWEHWLATMIYGAVCLISVGVAYFTFIHKNHTEFYFIIIGLWLLVNSIVFLSYLYANNTIFKNGLTGFSGILNDRNNFSIQTVILLVLSDFTTRYKRLQTVFTLWSIVLLFYSGSLTGLTLLLIYTVIKIQTLNTFTKIYIFAALSVLAIYQFTNNAQEFRIILDRSSNIIKMILIGQGYDSSVSTRVWLLDQGLRVFSNNLFFGVGANNTSMYISYNRVGGTDGINTHNNFLEVLVTSGLVGFFIHYGIIVGVLLKIRHNKNKSKIQLLLSLYLVAGLGFVTDNHFICIYAYVVAFALYLAGRIPKRDIS